MFLARCSAILDMHILNFLVQNMLNHKTATSLHSYYLSLYLYFKKVFWYHNILNSEFSNKVSLPKNKMNKIKIWMAFLFYLVLIIFNSSRNYRKLFAFSVGLNNSIRQLEAVNRSLEDFHYGDAEISDIVYEEIKKVSFYGASVSH